MGLTLAVEVNNIVIGTELRSSTSRDEVRKGN